MGGKFMSEEIITETNRETATDHEYGGAQIQVLEGLEAVRKRPGMYIGSTGPSGLHHLVYEIVDNSIDEALAGYCTHIEVTIKPGNIIEVSDNGRGIPVDIQPKLGIPAVTVVYTVLHAGGKFGGEDSGYKVAGGLHGGGASVVNALSEWLVVHVRRDGAEYEQSFKRGKPDGDLKKIGVAASTGTTVTFKPDPEMFTETTEYDYEILLKRLREESFLNAGVRITLTDERPESIEKNDGVPPQESMCYEGGVRSFVQYLHEKRDLTPLHPQVIYMKGEANGAVAEVALQYCDSYNELILSFANNVHTPEGGMHEEGFKRALTNALNAYGRRMKLLKEDEKVSGEDCREGLTCIISVKLTEAQFEGQTKAKLGNSEIRTLVNNIVTDKLSEYLEENPAVGRAILDKALMANRAREAARKARRDEVKKWYDEYWKVADMPGSRYSLQLAAAAMDFFKDDKEMFDPSAVKMQEVIVREGKKDDPKMTVLLEEAVNSYTKNYMAGYKALGRELDANALRNHFYRFPGVDNSTDKTLSAMLRMAVIAQTQEAFEKAPAETDEQRAAKAAQEGLVKQLFVELKRDFKPSDLPPYTLVKLGMHLANTSQPEESIAYFDEILDPSEPNPVRKQARINGMSKYRKNAVFGKAVALGRSKDNAKVDTAIKMMRDELSKEESSSNPDRKAMEDAQYNLVKFTAARQDWPAVIAPAEKYRADKSYKKNLPEVLFLQGQAYLKQNEPDKALVCFMNITGADYKGLVKWSAPAMLAQMDTLWNRNKMSQGTGKQPYDRYVAWRTGSQYVQLLDTPANRKRMTAEDSDLLNQVKDKVSRFGSDPAVSQERSDIAAYEAAIRSARGQK